MTTTQAFYDHLSQELQGIRDAGLYKSERIITSPQGALVRTADGREVINLCANNYLGLSAHPEVLEAAHAALRLGVAGHQHQARGVHVQAVHHHRVRKPGLHAGRQTIGHALAPPWHAQQAGGLVHREQVFIFIQQGQPLVRRWLIVRQLMA